MNLDLLSTTQRLALITALTNRWLGMDEEVMQIVDSDVVDATTFVAHVATSQERLDLIRHLAHGRIPNVQLPDPGPQGDAAL